MEKVLLEDKHINEVLGQELVIGSSYNAVKGKSKALTYKPLTRVYRFKFKDRNSETTTSTHSEKEALEIFNRYEV